MPKTIKEFQLNQSTGEVSVEYSDDSTSNFNAADMVTAQTDALTGGIGFNGLGFGALRPTEKYTFTGFDASAITSYAGFIAAIDAWAGGKSVTKTDRGQSSDATKNIYDYSAGDGPINVLLVSCQHGPEVVGAWACFQWFKEFVTSQSYLFSTLRKHLTVTWVPVLNPYGFQLQRQNKNSVDLNRNWNHYWSRYSNADPNYYKGTAAFSEKETQAVKTIIDARKIRAVIDCHNQEPGYSSNDIMTSPPSWYSIHNRNVFNNATKNWSKSYGGVFAEMTDPFAPEPTLTNWSSYYNTAVNDDYNATSVLIECAADMGGSSVTNLTSAAATKYCGFITCWLLAFIDSLSSAPRIPDHSWQARRVNEAATTSISTGGSLIDQTSWTSFYFDEQEPWPVGYAARPYLDCPLVAKGYLEVFASGYVQSNGAGEQRVDFGISLDGATPIAHSFTSINVPSTSGARTEFSCSAKFIIDTADANYVPRLALQIMKVGTTQNPFVKRARMHARFVPRFAIEKTPYF